MPLSDMHNNKKSKVFACTFFNLHFPKTLPFPLPLPVEDIALDVSTLNPPPFLYENR